MSGYTPGPWEILYAGQDEMTEAECIEEEMPVVSIGPINYLEFPTIGGVPEDIAREYADAKLIAAAPELLEGARLAVGGELSPGGEAFALLKAAIEKAEGKA